MKLLITQFSPTSICIPQQISYKARSYIKKTKSMNKGSTSSKNFPNLYSLLTKGHEKRLHINNRQLLGRSGNPTRRCWLGYEENRNYVRPLPDYDQW
jgi:hypothetical protein